MNKEKTILQTYKLVAGAIVEKHLAVLGSQTKERKPQGSYKDVYQAVKLINSELETGAEKILADMKRDSSIDLQRLKELLFLVRRDFFNEVLNRNDQNLSTNQQIAYISV